VLDPYFWGTTWEDYCKITIELDANAVTQWLQTRGQNQGWKMADLQQTQELANQINILSSRVPRLLKQEEELQPWDWNSSKIKKGAETSPHPL